MRGRPVELGLRRNWQQFALLVAINAFVGGMVGLERSILPVLAEQEFHVGSTTAVVSFIVTFGLTKAFTNLAVGRLLKRFSRRQLLIAGWLVGVPVPLIVIFAPSWEWIVAANGLLGINQGLAWSMTVNMKVDLVGPRRRGLALGLNEAAGYTAVAAAALASGLIADQYGLRPEPFYLGIAFAAFGLALSALFVKDTQPFVALESKLEKAEAGPTVADTVHRQRRLLAVNQAGFVNNLNDGLAWGVFPLFFLSRGLDLDRIALLAALYPLLWGVLQVGSGWISDVRGRTALIASGMFIQAAGIALAASVDHFRTWAVAVALLGLGTAMVYPNLLAVVGDLVEPAARASHLGIYRFWRDIGAAVGALGSGVLADAFGFAPALYTVAALTALSGLCYLFLQNQRDRRLLKTEVGVAL
ncbi:MAG: MFS transporter [Dehalococcoidia bacterium]